MTFNHLFSPVTGTRHRTTVAFTPGEAAINGALHRWLCCPDPPLVLEATCQMWNPLHNGECWEHGVPWTFGKDSEKVVRELGKKNLRCNANTSHFGFQAIHPNHFVFSRYYDVNKLDHFPRSLDTSTRFVEIFDQAYFPNHKNPALLHIFEHVHLFATMQKCTIASRKT